VTNRPQPDSVANPGEEDAPQDACVSEADAPAVGHNSWPSDHHPISMQQILTC